MYIVMFTLDSTGNWNVFCSITNMNKVNQINFVLFLSEHHSITPVTDLDKSYLQSLTWRTATRCPSVIFLWWFGFCMVWKQN